MYRIRQRMPILLTVLLLLAMALSACASFTAGPSSADTDGSSADADSEAAPASLTQFTISGSTSARNVLSILTDAYTEDNPEVTFNYLSGGGSDGGIQGALGGQIDMGAIARLPTEDEVDEGLAYKVIAIDKIAVVVTPDVPISDLSQQQVQDIFAGEITNWSEVDGPDATIKVFIREPDNNTTRNIQATLLEDTPFGETAILLESGSDYREALNTSTSGIGYLKYGSLQQSEVAVNTLTIDGLDPASQDGSYPYVAPVVLVYRADAVATVQPLLDFITTPEAVALLADEGLEIPEE